ncbi:hypothetical protein GIB67_041316 [Kingdonia uniflora]|uniref:Helicase C-terminal domain-containing protein n=1 Tax=Kingdonia uniflora TaxID=39325 RepID=A0A7J7NII4_9MAGN|nr:hypothetical protein GIB67_041316 [Kingdonia uniflora]
MVDQLKKLPHVIQDGLIWDNQTSEEASQTMQQLVEGNIKVLFVSPERFLNAGFLSVRVYHLWWMKLIAFLSGESHNFGPFYLRLGASLLRGKLNVDCVLAMTATTTLKTLQVVATVAFGISYSSFYFILFFVSLVIESSFLNTGFRQQVIHYSLPENLEEYVQIMLMQETGRAGRDGRLSYCHLLFDETTYFKLCSFMYSDAIDEYSVNKFLHQIFNSATQSSGKICSLVKDSASQKFDMKEEVMLTILTYFELDEMQYLRLLHQLSVTCTLYFHKISPSLLAGKDILVTEILKKFAIKQGHYTCGIPSVANSLGITAIDMLNRLQNLKSKGEITYELTGPAFCYTVLKNPEGFCSLVVQITRWLSEVEICKVHKLDEMFNAVSFAAKHARNQRMLRPFLRADIKIFLQSNSHVKFNPRAVARIMQGISSPAYPSAVWGRYSKIDFPVVIEAATAELMNVTGKDVL